MFYDVVRRVRLIGITCLVIVHTLCRWPVDYSVLGSARAAQYAWSEWMRLVVGNAEQFGFLLVSRFKWGKMEYFCFVF